MPFTTYFWNKTTMSYNLYGFLNTLSIFKKEALIIYFTVLEVIQIKYRCNMYSKPGQLSTLPTYPQGYAHH